MSLRYILGRSGTGKTTLCFDEIIENNKKNDNALIYIVPEQFSLQSEKNIVSRCNAGAIIKIHVLSFKRLAYYVISETGLKAGKILEETGKFILLRKIISDLKGQFQYYENINITKGFIEKISEAITEFFEYNVSVEQLIENAGNDERLILKLKDLGLIYENFMAYLGHNYISIDETLDILSGKIHESDFLNNAEIWIDGFSSFTPQELGVIKSLMEKVRRINIALSSNSPYIHFTNLKRADIFYETKDTIMKLNSIALETGIKVEKSKYLKLTYRYNSSAELKFLEENYFNYASSPYKGINRRIKTYGAKNRYDEVVFTADYINHMVRENNYRYADIAIILSDIGAYENVIKPVFDLYGLPYFIDSNTDILTNSLTEAIRALTEIYVRNWSYESIIRFLRTGLTNICFEDIDILENYLIAYGIKGYKWGQEQWYYGFGSDNSVYDSREINRIKNEVTALLSNFNHGTKFQGTLTVKDFCIKIYNFLNMMEVQKKISALYERALDEQNDILARQYMQIWDILKSLFEKLVEIMGDVKMGIDEFSSVLDAGFFSLSMGNIPAVQDQIIIGDLVRSRIHNIKAIFILGANEGAFPAVRKESGIFTDDERKAINENGFEIGPDSISRTFQDNFILYSSLTKAESILTITYPFSEISGKALFPSTAVQRINKLFPDSEIKNREAISLSVPDAVFEKVLSIIKGGNSVNEMDNGLMQWFMQNPKYKEKMIQYIQSADTDKKEVLSRETIAQLYGENIKTSISRLEKYVSCPFAFFVEYNLMARERQSYKVKRVDLGNLFHYILEAFSQLLLKDKILWTELDEDQIHFYTEKAFNIVQSQIESDLFVSDEKNSYILLRVKRIAEKSLWALSKHIKNGSFIPYGAEVDFGIKSPVTGIVIEIDEQYKFTLTGRIDRIDILDTEGKAYVKIIDYKSGSKKFDITDIYYGMQLQLLLYMKSILENGKNILKNNFELLPGGILYFKIDDPVIQLDKEKKKDEIEQLILEKYKMSGLVLEDETVIKAMDKDIDRNSAVIPVSMLAKGGISYNRSSVADYSVFSDIMAHAVHKVKETGKSMVSGNIEARPFKKGPITGCSYCNYNVICGFDTLTKDYSKYQIFKKINSIDVFKSQEDEGKE